jgi:hypothetical protein
MINKEERVIPLNRKLYQNQEEYFNQYFTRGGIIEAAVDNMES